MKSITLSTGICLAILGASFPAHAETAPFSDLLKPTCDACHLSPSELHSLDFSFSHNPTVQLNPASSLTLASDHQRTSPVGPEKTTAQQFRSVSTSPTGAISNLTLDGISPSSSSSSRQSVSSHLATLPPQQTLISQAKRQQDASSLAPISTSARDLAQTAQASPTDAGDEPDQELNEESQELNDESQEPSPPVFSVLANQQFQQSTALHLPKGVVALSLTNRLFFVAEQEGTAAYPNVGVTWGITDSTELDLSLQVVDTGSPDVLGGFTVIRVENRDLTLSVKQRLWKNPTDTLAFSGVFSLGVPLTNRTFEFNPGFSEDNSLIPAIQLPVTASVGNRWQFTLSPTIAFFPDSNAVFLPLAPIDEPGSFGTTFGLTGAISYQVHPRLTLWGDAFVPFTGNNSFDRDSGLPAKAVAFNAGLRYLFNPNLGLDVFASNTFGSRGPLALTADRDMAALGVRVTALPSLFAANRRVANSANGDAETQDSPNTTDGLAFFDGGTVPNQRFLFHLQGGGQGLLTALRYGLTKDLEVATFLDYIPNDVDESEQGVAIKLRFLNQAEGAPLTASGAVAVGLTNNIFDNFDNNNINGLFRQGAPRDFPLLFQADSDEGRRFIATFTLPLHYKVSDQLAFWFTPTASFVQRGDIDLGGFNVGGSIEVIKDFSLVGELGANILGEGNAFIGETLADRIPWSVAVRWDPSSIIGGESRANRPKLEFFVTNRVGSSPFHQLRVRNQNGVTVGAGISVPF